MPHPPETIDIPPIPLMLSWPALDLILEGLGHLQHSRVRELDAALRTTAQQHLAKAAATHEAKQAERAAAAKKSAETTAAAPADPAGQKPATAPASTTRRVKRR